MALCSSAHIGVRHVERVTYFRGCLRGAGVGVSGGGSGRAQDAITGPRVWRRTLRTVTLALSVGHSGTSRRMHARTMPAAIAAGSLPAITKGLRVSFNIIHVVSCHIETARIRGSITSDLRSVSDKRG